MGWRKGQLWKNSDFLKLWAGETVSLFGSSVTNLALPLTAVLVLQASPSQVAFLNTANYLPYLLLTLFVGLWVDRAKRRPLLIVTNLARGVLVGSVPVLALIGQLHMEFLYIITFLVGALTVVFNLSYRAYFPSLVSREHLMEGNSKLQASDSLAEVGGPGLAGWLVQLLTAPFALVIDAFSYLIAGLAQFLIRTPEPVPPKPEIHQSFRNKLSEGFRFIFSNASLRSIVLEAGSYNACSQIIMSLFLVYATRELGFEAWLLGLIFSVGSVGALIGSVTASAFSKWLGLGKAIISSMLVACLPMLVIPLVSGDKTLVAVLFGIALIINGVGLGWSNVYVVSLRQAMTPDHLIGRASATYSLVGMGALPLGSLVAGFLVPLLGLRLTILVGAIGISLAPLWVIFSPLAKLDALPDEEVNIAERV